ncbi:MAG: NifU family protein [Ignavibacteriales bacterium]|nr:NifU family protein [Ignavibacteriales bacterium]
MEQSITDRVQSSLNSIRHYLQADGGDVELVRITDDGFVEVKLTGACVGCPMSRMTLRAGVERRLLRDIPEIKRVEQVLC